MKVVEIYIINWASSHEEMFIKQLWKYLYDRGLIALGDQLKILEHSKTMVRVADISPIYHAIRILTDRFNVWVMQQAIHSIDLSV